jgi:DNA-binding response OmpR family regulator
VTHRVLVVEDEQDLARMLVRLLEGEGYVVDAVHDGQAGLHRGLTSRYDVLVLDRGLPGIDGIDLLRRLRRSGVTAPALMLTAYDTVSDRVEGLDSGAQDYLGKPFDVDELLARLRSLVRRAGTEDGAEMIDLGVRRLDVAARLVVGDGPDVQLSRWPGARPVSSPGTSCGTGCSATPRPTQSSRPTSPTCAASSGRTPSARCAAWATGWGPCE